MQGSSTGLGCAQAMGKAGWECQWRHGEPRVAVQGQREVGNRSNKLETLQCCWFGFGFILFGFFYLWQNKRLEPQMKISLFFLLTEIFSFTPELKNKKKNLFRMKIWTFRFQRCWEEILGYHKISYWGQRGAHDATQISRIHVWSPETEFSNTLRCLC